MEEKQKFDIFSLRICSKGFGKYLENAIGIVAKEILTGIYFKGLHNALQDCIMHYRIA